jgi:hypothetical protein
VGAKDSITLQELRGKFLRRKEPLPRCGIANSASPAIAAGGRGECHHNVRCKSGLAEGLSDEDTLRHS